MVRITAQLISHYTEELDKVSQELSTIGLSNHYFDVRLTVERHNSSGTFTVKAKFDIKHGALEHEIELETQWGISELEKLETGWLYPAFNSAWCKYLLAQNSTLANK